MEWSPILGLFLVSVSVTVVAQKQMDVHFPPHLQEKVDLNPLDDGNLPEPFCHPVILFSFKHFLSFNSDFIMKDNDKSVSRHPVNRSASNS